MFRRIGLLVLGWFMFRARIMENEGRENRRSRGSMSEVDNELGMKSFWIFTY